MADDDVTDAEQDALDEAGFDNETFDEVQAALAGLSHLDPARVVPDGPIPDWAWEKVSHALSNEASARAAATHDNVVLLPTAAAAAVAATEVGASTGAVTPARARHSRRNRWGGGLVAAAVTVVAVAVAVPAMRSSSGPAIVAGKARPAAAVPLASSAAAQPSAQAFAEMAASSDAIPAASGPADAVQTAPLPVPTLVQPRSGSVQAARMVKDTGTAYEHEQLPSQITALLDTVGVNDVADIATMPQATTLPPEDGFTETWATLRDCITWLTQETDSQALVVDRGTYEGDAAGVVVAPADPSASGPSASGPSASGPSAASPGTPAPTLSMDTSAGRLDVWVVTPKCEHVASTVEDYLPYELQP